MTGFGSPCGACKFLRRKCTRGCVFAPYFCHDQGATHFAAVHKVFGASNVSKLLMHLSVSDRREAAVTIAYEAQARLQDPIYGCVSHIFALQKQVVNLQAQLATIKAQSAQNMINGLTSTSFPEEETKFLSKLNAYQQDLQGLCNNTSGNSSNMYCSNNGSLNWNSYVESSQICGSNNYLPQELLSFGYETNSSVDSLDMLMKTSFRDMEDLESVAYAYLHHS